LHNIKESQNISFFEVSIIFVSILQSEKGDPREGGCVCEGCVGSKNQKITFSPGWCYEPRLKGTLMHIYILNIDLIHRPFPERGVTTSPAA
jgi:hypothetical protein